MVLARVLAPQPQPLLLRPRLPLRRLCRLRVPPRRRLLCRRPFRVALHLLLHRRRHRRVRVCRVRLRVCQIAVGFWGRSRLEKG